MVTDTYSRPELYAAAFSWPVHAEVEGLLAETGGPDSVLEPFCGQARYAKAFVEHGVRYTGVDIEPAMLALAPSGDGITLVEADVRSFSIPGLQAGLAYTPVNSFCHLLSEEDVVAHLRTVAAHLAPGALYAVELELVNHDGPWTDGDDGKGTWDWDMEQADGSVVTASVARTDCNYAARTCVEHALFRRLRDGTEVDRLEYDVTMRMWTAADLPRVLADAGWAVDRIVANLLARERKYLDLSEDLENAGSNATFFLKPSA
ncbi:MAG: class I SAM-dependent methyltransferase [Planctomycetota bacterium]